VFDSAYISRMVPLGPADAIEATEAWYRNLPVALGHRRLVGGHRLTVRPSFEPTNFDPLLLRRLRGTLWVGWWWPVRVDLELTMYSGCASEIALRPSTLRWPVAIERYGEDAGRAVEEVVVAITMGRSARVDHAREPNENGQRLCPSRPTIEWPWSRPDRRAPASLRSDDGPTGHPWADASIDLRYP
jgi:hypothetical protein